MSLCNWIYDSDNERFIASDENGLTKRKILLISPEDASRLFGWDGESHQSSKGEWESLGYGLDDGDEMVILHERIATKIEKEANISRIQTPTTMEPLRWSNVESSKPKFQFIGSILTLDFFVNQVRNKGIGQDLISESLKNRKKCTVIEYETAKQNYDLPTQGILSVGPGGWDVIDLKDRYLLVHGRMPNLVWSLHLLKNLLLQLDISKDIISFQTKRIGSHMGRRQCEYLIQSEPEKEDYVSALLGDNIEEQSLVQSLNPWSSNEEECRQYSTRFTLDNLAEEFLNNENDWQTQDNAKKKLVELRENYKNWADNQSPRTQLNRNLRNLIDAMYHGRICIVDGKQHLSSDSDDTVDIVSPAHRTSISKNMIGNSPLQKIADKIIGKQDLLPDILIASGDAIEKLRRTENPIRLDFVEGFYEKMSEVVDSEHWDRSGNWVLTDSVLISPQGDKVGIWLHKLHHLHITALYTVISSLES